MCYKAFEVKQSMMSESAEDHRRARMLTYLQEQMANIKTAITEQLDDQIQRVNEELVTMITTPMDIKFEVISTGTQRMVWFHRVQKI